jgi:hypothetical protein
MISDNRASVPAANRPFGEGNRRIISSKHHLLVFMLVLAGSVCRADEIAVAGLAGIVGKSFKATDSLQVGIEASQDATECLQGLTWPPAAFDTTCDAPWAVGCGDALVRFPSPVASGNERNDSVSMEWFVVRDQQQQPIRAKAVVVVHESGSSMTVGRMFARGLHHRGFHTFLLHLPYYGQRRAGARPDDKLFFTLIRQAIADVRRARDAVASLPLVDSSHIALQGTSLGGFVSATSAAIDDRYDSVFITLAGGDLFDMIQNGQKDTAKVREKLTRAGLDGEQLRALVYRIEPTRIAHRLNPQRTWLYSGTFDTVVPLKNATALATAANLESSHHIKLLANHFTGIIFLPSILDHMRDRILHVAPADQPQPADQLEADQ